MDNRGSFFFFLLVIYLLLSSQSRPALIDEDRARQHELNHERQVLRVLNGSKYGDFDPPANRWLPFSGLRGNDSYAWDLLPQVKGLACHQLQSAVSIAGLEPPDGLVDPTVSPTLNLTKFLLPVYRNSTGKLRGDWVRRTEGADRREPLNTTAIAEEHEYFTHEFSHNITGNGGTFYFDLEEGGGEEIQLGDGILREMRASLTVESEDFWGSTWYISLFGVHFPDTGSIVLTTSSEKFDGVFLLPHFMLSSDTYELSHELLLKSLSDTISEKQNRPPTLFPWSSLAGTEQMEFSAPKCEHIIFLQQHPVMLGDATADRLLLERMEQELRYPMGAPIPEPPLMVMSAVVFSPDCGYILHTKGAPEFPPSESLYVTGPKHEEYSKYAARLIFVVSGVFVAQITLLLRQIKEASTPSTRSRISFYTIALMALGDAFVLTFIVLELYAAVSFLVLATASFLAFLSVSYIGMKFMMEIWAVQEPERREQDRPPNPSVSTTRPDTLPLPATALAVRDSGATAIILSPDQDPPENEMDSPPPATRTAPQPLGKFAAIMLILSIWAFLLPRRLGSIYTRFLAAVYLSFWVPQIYRNVMRNCRKALRWDFVAGQSVLRLFPFLYFLTARGNVLFIRPDYTSAFIMTGWVWIQAWILVSQDVLGPRFFVPQGWAPHAYDYHPMLRDLSGVDDDLEGGGVLSIASLRGDERDLVSDSKDDGKQRKDRKKAIFDCAICMQDIEVPVLPAPSSSGGSSVTDGASSILSRRLYMVTPCRHIFHTACLESWMRLRLQCPICRESIPPV
ncbi:putative RING finger protein [Penicillium digitatum Pd1]|uniref:DSC E3 ubiquitin ligase complex subunit A n=1 Tax=Penicillium digitatum (strain Pd1 / CECT 20795) TaxID=1170230 RepID=K9FBK1_PEND1|nr:putative RING finger protein [Penicillium digitatum Pd1]EKV06775.1 putative RING finger protein [Penicillium digitatum Pd1]